MADLFEMDLDSGMEFLDQKLNKKNDGLLRLDLKKAKDPKKGFKVVLRFLPNLMKSGKVGVAAIEKIISYVKLPEYPDLQGYYDSMKNFDPKCPIESLYWELKNSKSAVDNEKATQITKSYKYYSYVQILEHELEPELVGKIMIFPFGKKIMEKIKMEKSGELTGTQVNVYDPVKGKDFTCIVKEVGEFANYDLSFFKQNSSPLYIPSKDGSLKQVPLTEENGVLKIKPDFQEKVKEYLLNREFDLETHAPMRWNDETKDKVDKIISIMKNKPLNESKPKTSTKNDDTLDFFNDDNDDTSTDSDGGGDDDDLDF